MRTIYTGSTGSTGIGTGILTLLTLLASTGVALAGPDLVVTSITVDPGQPKVGEGTISAVIENVGDSWTGLVNIDITMYLDGVECDTGIIFAGLSSGSSAGEDTTSCNPSTPGLHTIRYVVDSTFEVDEDNESNNSKEASFTWYLPDLRVAAIAIDPPFPYAGQEGTITATILNDSPADVGCDLFDAINVSFTLDGVECDTGIIICGLGGNATATEETGSCIPDTFGPHTIGVMVDSDFDVPEQNEQNNFSTSEISWYLPDLTVTALDIDPAFPYAGSEGTLTAYIDNLSPVGAPCELFDAINVTMFLDGVECDTGLVICGLGANAQTTEETSSCVPDTPGPHEVTFVVDADGDVPEMDETNNTLTKTIDWYWPDLIVTGVVASPSEPTAGDGVTFTASILNQGLVDVPCDLFDAINVTFTLDGADEPCDSGLILCGLDAGATATEDVSGCDPGTGGPHTLTVVVDSDGDFPEMDETNNSWSGSFFFCGDSELCNGLDDDCDGQTDEGFGQLGSPCVDVCPGVLVCKGDGSGTECDAPPPDEEACNGLDDDCDGDTDETWPLKGAACDGPDLDMCAGGTWTCNGTEDGLDCVGDAGVGPERCDGIDNDCDGTTDEDFPELGESCTTTAGDCTVSGVWACDASGTSVACDGTGAAELCNGQDDDCDGATDEEFPEVGAPCLAGAGACQALGSYACSGDGSSAVCDAPVGNPVDEQCGNAVDDDCDGSVDEDCACEAGSALPCGTDVGACEAGLQNCAGGVYSAECSGAVGPQTEICNGVDDDCDGSVDEACGCNDGAVRACAESAGACAAGQQTCVSGAWGACEGETIFAPEACGDAVDNDCDGTTDEGCGCTAGAIEGCPRPPEACADYARTCDAAGAWSPCQPVPGTEVPGCGEPGDQGPSEDTAGAPEAGTDAAPGADAGGTGVDSGAPVAPGSDVGDGGTNSASSDGCRAARQSPAPLVLLALALLGLIGVRRRRAALARV